MLLLCVLDTGVPLRSSAQVKWMQDDAKLLVLTELQAGAEHLQAEFHRDRTNLRWQYFSRLQHQVKALQKRGLFSSFQAKAHYQVQNYHLLSVHSLVFHQNALNSSTETRCLNTL